MTRIAILRETAPHEARCAATPDTVKKYITLGCSVSVQRGAGLRSGIADSAFESAGAALHDSTADTLHESDILLCVHTPESSSLHSLKEGACLVGMLAPQDSESDVSAYPVHAFALERLPRISRAQAMDVLSSQSNLAGLRAVIEAVAASGKLPPMLMTAAGTVPPAKALVIGAGVAGLQAIATARRLGAVVSAFDVRAAAKEQVQSLGAKFIEVPVSEQAETSGGYAKEVSAEYKSAQAALLHEALKTQDVVITTALIPGKPAPEIITEAMLSDMKPGSVIVDMAASAGGNVKGTVAGEVVQIGGVTLIGYTDLPSRAALDATPLYARNLYQFVSTLILKDGALAIAWEDELVKATVIERR